MMDFIREQGSAMIDPDRRADVTFNAIFNPSMWAWNMWTDAQTLTRDRVEDLQFYITERLNRNMRDFRTNLHRGLRDYLTHLYRGGVTVVCSFGMFLRFFVPYYTRVRRRGRREPDNLMIEDRRGGYRRKLNKRSKKNIYRKKKSKSKRSKRSKKK